MGEMEPGSGPQDSQQPPDQQGQQEDPELVVCIEKYASGKILVGTVNEGAEQEGSTTDDSGLQQVQSVQDALKVARDLLTNPNVPGADDAFASGYQQANGPQMSTKGMP